MLGGLLLAILGHCALAATPQGDDLFSTLWSDRDGAPMAITSLAQTSDGYLWIASPTGLHRFDALHFEHVDIPGHPELSSAPVYSLMATPDGGLWIGYALGGAAFLSKGTVRLFGPADGLPPGSVLSWGMQRDGTVWATTTTGVARMRSGHWERIALPRTTTVIGQLFVDGDDRVWLAASHRSFLLKPGQSGFQELPQRYALYAAFGQSLSGDVWMLDENRLQRVGNASGSRRRAVGSASNVLLFDHRGMVWATAEHRSSGVQFGVLRLPASSLSKSPFPMTRMDFLRSSDGSPTGSMLVQLEDREGNIWVSGNLGVFRFSKSRVFSLNSLAAWPSDRTFPGGTFVADMSGHVWVAETEHEVFRYDGERFVRLDRLLHASAGFRSRSGEIWLGGQEGLWRVAGTHVAQHLAKPTPEHDRDVQSMADDATGALWVSVVRGGVFRWADGRWQPRGGVAGLPDSPALIVASDHDGRVWLGYPDGRALTIADAKATAYGGKDGLDVGPVTAVEGRRAHLWLGGQRGLALMTATRFRSIEAETDGALRNITGLVETANGDVWVLGAIGLVRIPADEIARAIADPAHRVSAQLFDAREGLRGVAAELRPVPTLVEGATGQLIARTSEGLYRVDIRDVSRSPSPPTVTLRSLVADGRTYAAGASIELPPRAAALAFRYAALSLTAAEQVHYRYRLEGFDRDWQEVRDRREAFYTNLPPGQYRFHVQAGLTGDAWNPAEAVLVVGIRPAFDQTHAFLVLCVVLLALGICSLVHWRVRRASRQAASRERERIDVRLTERERIAREIHDTLLQNAHAVVMMIGAAASLLRKGRPATELLDRAASSGEQAIVEARERIYELRQQEGRSLDVGKELGSLGERLAGEAGAPRFVFRGQSPCMPADVAQEVLQIGSEALLNAYRHAQASMVEMEFERSNGAVALRIRDDGIGIGEETRVLGAAPGHWGLPGMRERARRLAATLTFDSPASGGTIVELRLQADAWCLA